MCWDDWSIVKSHKSMHLQLFCINGEDNDNQMATKKIKEVLEKKIITIRMYIHSNQQVVS